MYTKEKKKKHPQKRESENAVVMSRKIELGKSISAATRSHKAECVDVCLALCGGHQLKPKFCIVRRFPRNFVSIFIIALSYTHTWIK